MTSRFNTLALIAAGALLAGAVTPAPAARPETAPATVCLSGTVTGVDGQPRPGACVFPVANRRLIAVSDATGAFKLQLPAAVGSLQVQVEYFGLASRRIEVDGQHPQPVRVVLGP